MLHIAMQMYVSSHAHAHGTVDHGHTVLNPTKIQALQNLGVLFYQGQLLCLGLLKYTCLVLTLLFMQESGQFSISYSSKIHVSAK